MRKIFLLVVASIAMTMFANESNAQPRSIGARLGYNFDVSYQHTLTETNFIEVDAGLLGYGYGFQASAQYNWLFDIPISKGDMNWYAGIGAGVGFGWDNYNGFSVGAVPQIGFEYIFDNIPLQLSLDYKPNIGIRFYSDGVMFNTPGFYDFGLSVRYVF